MANQTVTVLEADGVTETDVEVLGFGRQAAAASKSVVLGTEDIAAIGSVTETAPASDTASSGLNGRLQRIAQRLSTLITAVGTLAFGTGAASGALRVVVANEQTAGDDYDTVAASQTAETLHGAGAGATGDFLSHVMVRPLTTSPGNVLIYDNATEIAGFEGGTDSVSNLVPFPIFIGAASVSGAWKITTGANVEVVAFGSFT
jgi:hypothetical protein